MRHTVLALGILAADARFLDAQDAGQVVAADRRVQARSYVFEQTGESIPYALFVPSNYDGSKRWPVIVGLHGAGRPFDWVMGYEGLVDMAERDGFIVVTPTGYHPLGGFGAYTPWRGKDGVPSPWPANAPALERLRPLYEEGLKLPVNVAELSERDVMNVLALVRKEFNVAPDRIYLFGHSMGGGGAYHLAATHPGTWAAVVVAAPSFPMNLPDLIPRFTATPVLVLQGAADDLVPAALTRMAVAQMQKAGTRVEYVEVPGGDHSLFISKNRDVLSRVFSFFAGRAP